MLNEYRPIQVFADQTEIASDNRVRVQGRSNMTLLPDFFLVDIYNLSDYDKTTLYSAKELYVYGEKNSIICYGEIEGLYEHEEGSNQIISVSVSDGQSFWQAKADITVGGGAWVKDTIRMILEGAKLGVFVCDDIRMPRGQTFSGRIADIINVMAVSVRARAYIFCGTLFMVGKDSPVNVVNIEPDDVIIEPKKVEDALIMKTKIKGYDVGGVVSYEDTKYRVITRAVDADNFAGEWSTEMTLVREEDFTRDRMGGGW